MAEMVELVLDREENILGEKKTFWEKAKRLHTSIFSFSSMVFQKAAFLGLLGEDLKN